MTYGLDRSVPVLVAGGGGFIGGWLVRDLLAKGFGQVRSVDVKPVDEWYQRHPGVDEVVIDLKDREGCRRALTGSVTCSTLRPTWVGWASSRPTRPTACLQY